MELNKGKRGGVRPQHVDHLRISNNFEQFSTSSSNMVPRSRFMCMGRNPYYVDAKFGNTYVALPPTMMQLPQNKYRPVQPRMFRSESNVAYQRNRLPFSSPQRYRLPTLSGHYGSSFCSGNRMKDRKFKSFADLHGSGSFCQFCKTNGEQKCVYTAHNLKDSSGRNQCPILRRHICEICGATGDYAHTKSHCPECPDKVPLRNRLVSTPTLSSGQKRYFGKHH